MQFDYCCLIDLGIMLLSHLVTAQHTVKYLLLSKHSLIGEKLL